jgi:hypothetical protein
VLRPGNAGAITAAGHLEAARLALAQLPRRLRRKVLARADSGGGTHEFLTWLTAKSPAPQTATQRSRKMLPGARAGELSELADAVMCTDGRLLPAVDVSSWLRPGVATSPDRAFCHGGGTGRHK